MAIAFKHICWYGFASTGVGCALGALLGILGVIPQEQNPFSLVLVIGPLGLILGTILGIWKSLEGHAASIARTTPRAAVIPKPMARMSGPSINILRTVLVTMSVVYVLAGLAAGIFSIPAAMLFDAPESKQRPELWLIFCSIVAFPAMCFFAIKWSWHYYDAQQIPRAYLSLCLPLISFVGLAVGMLIEHMTHR